MGDILVYVEYHGSEVKKTSFELLSKAEQLASQAGGKVTALLIGHQVEALASQLAPYGANQVLVAENAELEKYNTIAYSNVLAKAIESVGPSIVLGTSSPLGRDLFPRVAAKIKAGLAADATELKIENGKLVATRPVYSGKALVDVNFKTDVQMAITRPNSFPTSPAKEGAQAEVSKLDVSLGEIQCKMVEEIQGASDKTDLTEAEIIVSGGRAMGNAENFQVLQKLADVIGATVGASRAAVDSGYAGHDMQVGQTGKVVNPKLYMAFGISGAIQHLAGMRTSKIIVAVNKDPEAPIFSKADYGIVGDLFELAPLITEELKKIVS